MSKVVLITGASRGIGAETARLAAARGYSICVNYRHDAEAAGALLDALREGGHEAFAFQADVSDEAQVKDMFEAVDSRFGRLDALVNNAGILEPHCDLIEMTPERWRRVLDINVVGSFLCAREAVRRMASTSGGDGGAIVNVSSRAADLGSPHEYIDYAAAKGAVDSMTIGLAREVASLGIRVNAVKPGLIYTDIHASGGEAGRVDRLKAGVPMQRGGLPAEVAEAILWLMSDASAYTTGSFIDVSGGR
jgi:NAD(P)-dependent dehydrogenase (short-subunit alcohol dehydrogenase family)